MRGTRFFFMMVTALLIMAGVSMLMAEALASIWAQLAGVTTTPLPVAAAPVAGLMLSQ